jgi:uncharacterized protein
VRKLKHIFKLNKSIILGVLLVATLVFVTMSCKKKSEKKSENSDDVFDKQALLVNMADQLIIPGYTEFKVSLENLNRSYANFEVSESLSDFQETKTNLHLAYLNYQRISLFGLGPGEDLGIRANFNVFPCKTSLIQSNITSGTYDLNAISNIATKGFPALDYLFYGENKTEAELINLFVTEANRKKYVSDLLNEMLKSINTVISEWNNNYRTTFINSLGTDVGSSLGFLINQMNYELDYLKNSKFAIPLGLKSGGTLLPDNCEAYYGGQSLQYALETLTIIENTYLGKSFDGADGKGFDDYLDHLGINYIDGTLNNAIKNQFLTAKTKLKTLGNPLSDQVVSNNAAVNAAYKELVKLLVLLKTDLPSNLGVVITYQDGDGD